MIVLSKFVFRVTFLLFILWFDFNLMSRILVFDLRLSLLLLLIVLLQNYQDIDINDWYFPIFILGFINDLIIPRKEFDLRVKDVSPFFQDKSADQLKAMCIST